jgi:hypothetical protein
MDGVNEEVDGEFLAVNLNGKNTDQVTWVVFSHLFYETLDELEHTLLTSGWLCNDSEIQEGHWLELVELLV